MKKQVTVPDIYPPEVMDYHGPEGYSPQHGELKQGRVFLPGDLVRGVYDDWIMRGILKPLEART